MPRRECMEPRTSLSVLKSFFRKPFEIDGTDARSAQKTPAGVLFVRRGLFFVKRQRRCTVYFQKVKSPSILCNFTVYSCFIVFR